MPKLACFLKFRGQNWCWPELASGLSYSSCAFALGLRVDLEVDLALEKSPG